jgi:hypothetical protein
LQERETVLQQKSSELTGQLSKLNNEASAREEEYVSSACTYVVETYYLNSGSDESTPNARFVNVSPYADEYSLRSLGSPRAV